MEDRTQTLAVCQKVLAMDAFARCWVQEEMLFNAIGDVLPAEDEAAYKVLQSVWRRGRQAAYANSIEAMARHLQKPFQHMYHCQRLHLGNER